MKVLLVEDEPLALERLEEHILKFDPEIEVVGRFDSVSQTLNYIKKNDNFDMAFLDIKLADGLSFSIFDKVNSLKPTIFTTAYDNYTLSAFKTNCIDYLLKPIQYKDLERALNKFYAISTREDQEQKFEIDETLIAQLTKSISKQYKQRFLVKSGAKFSFIKASEVSLFEASGKWVSLVSRDKGMKFIIDHKLEELEETLLDPSAFFRINRSYIVAADAILEAKNYYNNRLKIKLNTPFEKELILSRDKVSKFKTWLNK